VSARAALALVLAALAVAAPAAAQDEAKPGGVLQRLMPGKGEEAPLALVIWEAPEELRVLFEQHLPEPPAEARQDRQQLRRWIRDVRRRAPEIAAAEGWFSAEVEIDAEGEGPVRAIVKAGERAKVVAVSMEFRGDIAGEGDYRESRRRALQESWGLVAGKTFRQADWDEAKARVVEALTADDYAAGELALTEARVDAAAAAVRIKLVLDSGPAFSLGEAQVSGLARYSPRLVERLLDIDPGEPYRTERLLELQRRLQSTPWFAGVSVEIDRDPAKPVRVPIRIAITERPVADVGVSLGYGTDVGARGEVSLRYRNAFSRGLDMHSAVQADKTRQVGYADFYLPPGAFPTPFLSAAGVIGTRDSFGVLGERTDNQGLETQRGAVAAWRAFIYQKVELRLGLSFQVEKSIPDGAESSLSRALAPMAQFTWRGVDDVLNPARGGVLALQLAGGAKAAASDQDFLRTYAQYQHWFALSPVDQLILRGEAGVVFAPSRDGIPEEFLFRAGGTRSVRGYKYESLGPREGDAVVGGRYLMTGTAEYVRWLSPQWGAALFVDAGDAADARGDLSANLGYGVGARWRTPAGPLAMDIAYADRDRKVRLSFSVSVAF
jgi:translocation and assembly module TamA